MLPITLRDAGPAHLLDHPAEIARQLELQPGSKLDWCLGDTPGTIIIQVKPSIRQLLDRAQELGRELKNRNLIEELIAERALEME